MRDEALFSEGNHPLAPLVPGRPILGVSAILLPLDEADRPQWADFDAHVQRTVEAGLIPAVNMDTGYAHLIDEPTRLEVLRRTEELTQGVAGMRFAAGAFVPDNPDSEFDADAYRGAVDVITRHGGTPVIFQSFGLTATGGSQSAAADEAIVERYRTIAAGCDAFIAFELAEVFAPFGRIYSLPVYEGLLGLEACLGAKHSSLQRELEWRRLALRDRVRPDFRVFTGNDLAIDMVMYGSDYLLGLSTFAPDWFARRDRWWREADRRFFELNDILQYLGFFAFRAPVPAYKHSAAMFLHLRGWTKTERTHPRSPRRPASDVNVLREILRLAESRLRDL